MQTNTFIVLLTIVCSIASTDIDKSKMEAIPEISATIPPAADTSQADPEKQVQNTTTEQVLVQSSNSSMIKLDAEVSEGESLDSQVLKAMREGAAKLA